MGDDGGRGKEKVRMMGEEGKGKVRMMVGRKGDDGWKGREGEGRGKVWMMGGEGMGKVRMDGMIGEREKGKGCRRRKKRGNAGRRKRKKWIRGRRKGKGHNVKWREDDGKGRKEGG
ncbi:hypothetical protein Pcinc_017672 [Petrolisthes cinctipes]|uniref:Uncharacterized protein n=1 Tax=Petrolisthes cinctipes TaxID=88211 RepID=A0AAE1FPT3_PETCI|nr:hypothetical protein Pcinc_017672 [Petrolisthes cinctipes]